MRLGRFAPSTLWPRAIRCRAIRCCAGVGAAGEVVDGHAVDQRGANACGRTCIEDEGGTLRADREIDRFGPLPDDRVSAGAERTCRRGGGRLPAHSPVDAFPLQPCRELIEQERAEAVLVPRARMKDEQYARLLHALAGNVGARGRTPDEHALLHQFAQQHVRGLIADAEPARDRPVRQEPLARRMVDVRNPRDQLLLDVRDVRTPRATHLDPPPS